MWLKAFGVCALVGLAPLAYADQEDHPNASMMVTVDNVTKGQTFSRPVVVVHRPGLRVFARGSKASRELRRLAEEGDARPLIRALKRNRRVVDVFVLDGIIKPGRSKAAPIDLPPRSEVTVLAMLTGTNDAFWAVEAIRSRRRAKRSTSFAKVYDAGTEANTEKCDDVPGCGAKNRRVRRGQEGTVTLHPGLRGDRDLALADYAWSGPVARVRIGPDIAGSFEFPLGLEIPAPGEMVLQEPSMCAGQSRAQVSYSKARNIVSVEVKYEGVPLDLETSFPGPPSTPYNKYPQSIVDGKWQTWIVGFFGGKPVTVWYDADNRLLGTKYSLPNQTPPPGAFSVELEAAHALCSPLWTPGEDGRANVRFDFKYDGLLDGEGSGGTVVIVAPYVFGDPGSLGILHTNGIPEADAFTFDAILDSVENRAGFAIASTYEPDPKPDYLLSRSNNVTAWLGTYPNQVASTPPLTCETKINPPWPAMAN